MIHRANCLSRYGFVTGEQSRQCLPLKVKLKEDKNGLIMEQFRNQIIRQLDLMQKSEEEFQLCLTDPTIPSTLLQVLRLMHIDVEDLR